jgi:hypothetical protein
VNGQSVNDVLSNLAAHGFTYRIRGTQGCVSITVYRKGVADYNAVGEDLEQCLQAMLNAMRASIAAGTAK